jgi:ubiquinone/menaquinone biosynthesis C-methylase UbiE
MKWFGISGYGWTANHDASFEAILCSEALEDVPDPTHTLDEFARLLKPGAVMILTAPFASNVHMPPYHYCSGFSEYWYEYHLAQRSFRIETLTANGDWYALLLQEISRLGGARTSTGKLELALCLCLCIIGFALFQVAWK